MKTQTSLSGIAVAALLLAITPVGAVSLNIGGDGGLISSGDSDSGSSGVSVGVGSGDDGGIDVDADVNNLLGSDGDGDGDGGLDVLGDKPLLDTGGDGLVTIDTEDDEEALITLFGDPDAGPVGDELVTGDIVEAEVLNEDRDEEVFLRLFGSGDVGTTATVDLGGDGDPVDIEVSGADGTNGDLADVELLGDDDTVAEVTLFGPGDDDTGGGDGAGGDDGSGGDDDGAGGEDAAAGDDDGTGGDGSGVDETTTASTGDGAAPVPATRVAARSQAGAGDNCFSPDQTQIAHLLGRSSYQPGDAEAWQQAARIDIVPVEICADAAAQLQAAIAADDNMSLLQSAVAADARLSAEVDPRAVLAVDQAGEELAVYIY